MCLLSWCMHSSARRNGCTALVLPIMIEFCTKKRMAAAIVMLIGISVMVVFIENRYSLDHDPKDATGRPDANECWENKDVNTDVVKECAPCTALDVKIQEFCKRTGYSETIKCKFQNGTEKEVSKSCPKLSWLEERNFWVFESCAAVIGLAAYSMVHIRRNRLDKLLLDKVHAQIAAGV